jgi:glutaconate CoA-transferase subunit B
MLLTTKGVFRFDDRTRELYLAQIHPGVKVESIKKDIPWELKIADDLSLTERPTDQEIQFVRRFAPSEVVGRKLLMELGIGNLLRKNSARAKGKERRD